MSANHAAPQPSGGEDLLAAIFTEARTHNRWQDRPVADADIRHAYDLAALGPASAHCQPLRIVLVRSDAGKSRLLPAVAAGSRPRLRAAFWVRHRSGRQGLRPGWPIPNELSVQHRLWRSAGRVRPAAEVGFRLKLPGHLSRSDGKTRPEGPTSGRNGNIEGKVLRVRYHIGRCGTAGNGPGYDDDEVGRPWHR